MNVPPCEDRGCPPMSPMNDDGSAASDGRDGELPSYRRDGGLLPSSLPTQLLSLSIALEAGLPPPLSASNVT